MITEAQNARRIARETTFIRRYLKAALALSPNVMLRVNDGEELHPATRDIAQAVEQIRAVDEAWVRVRDGDTRLGAMFFVLGNEPDEVLADWSWNESDPRLDAALNKLI